MAIINSNEFLTLEEMHDNAQYVYDALMAQGWTKNATCAILGNMQSESSINPGIWENLDEGNTSRGFGLVQWTPATKLIDWAIGNGADYHDINVQISRILYEVHITYHGQWIPTDEYPLSFVEFTLSDALVTDLAMAFLYNYERPAILAQPWRATQAQYWYDNLSGGVTPEPPTKKKSMSIWLYRFI